MSKYTIRHQSSRNSIWSYKEENGHETLKDGRIIYENVRKKDWGVQYKSLDKRLLNGVKFV